MPYLDTEDTPSARKLYLLDCDLSTTSSSGGRIITCNTNGTNLTPIISNMKTMPDGITIDHSAGHIYWTNMGTSLSSNTGSISRANLDGSNAQIIIPSGTMGVWTPKQICLAPRTKKLYWCDREGMKVMRSNLNGSTREVLISTGSSDLDREDKTNWCVGIAVDESRGYFYWSQKGGSKASQGQLFRAKISAPEERQILLENLPEPIDLEIDEEEGVLYWTDRGDPPRGNTLNRAVLNETGVVGKAEILAKRLHETIGLALDKEATKCYVTDLAGGVYCVDLRTKEKEVVFAELGDLTGIALL